jgi:hypothetical protein
MDAAFTQRGNEFRSKNPEKLTYGLIEPPGVFSETRDYTEWPFIRPEFFWTTLRICGACDLKARPASWLSND